MATLKPPPGMESLEISIAKSAVRDVIEGQLHAQGFDPHDESNPVNLITMADEVIEQLLSDGITIPSRP